MIVRGLKREAMHLCTLASVAKRQETARHLPTGERKIKTQDTH